MFNKYRLPFIILGIGIGIILTNTIYIFNPQIEYRDYSEKEIIAQATEMGMVFIKDNIETSSIEESDANSLVQKERLENEGKKVEEEEIQFKIEYGDSLDRVSKRLYKLGIIDNIQEFQKFAKDKKADKKLRVGSYKLRLNSNYETLIKTFTTPKS
jgi:hypothetical protein